MDLRQLRYFVAVAEEGSIRKASHALYVAHPPISLALNQLERELGIELFRRTPHGAELTDDGARFLEYARRILACVHEAEQEMKQRAGRARLALRVGLIEGVVAAADLTAPIFEGHRRQNPGLHLELEELSFCDQSTALLSGRIDVAIVRPPLQHREIRVVPIAAEPRVLWVGTQHPLADAEQVSVDEIVDQVTVPLGAPEEWSGFWQLDEVRGRPNTPAGAPLARTVANIQLAVASGGMAITAPQSMPRLLHNPLVRPVRLSGAAPSVIAVAYRRGEHRTIVHDFVEHAALSAERHIAALPGGTLPDR
jgi:DNA-binding transcriptional LysR family regulator